MKKKALAFVDLTDPQKPALRMVAKNAFMSDLGQFKNDEKVWVTVETFRRERSMEQNGLLHWYLKLIADETGDDIQSLKADLKMYLLERKTRHDKDGNIVYNKKTGEPITYIPSTADLDTAEMTAFIEKIIQWSYHYLNMVLPLPEKVRTENI